MRTPGIGIQRSLLFETRSPIRRRNLKPIAPTAMQQKSIINAEIITAPEFYLDSATVRVTIAICFSLYIFLCSLYLIKKKIVFS